MDNIYLFSYVSSWLRRPRRLLSCFVLLCSLAASQSPVSDNFDSYSLNSRVWTFVNPLGDAVLMMNGTAATLNVPLRN
jgi:hypothetical protein